MIPYCAGRSYGVQLGGLWAAGAAAVPQIRVYNKIDATGIAPGGERDPSGILDVVRVSALTGAGCPELRAALAERFPPREPLTAADAAFSAGVPTGPQRPFRQLLPDLSGGSQRAPGQNDAVGNLAAEGDHLREHGRQIDRRCPVVSPQQPARGRAEAGVGGQS